MEGKGRGGASLLSRPQAAPQSWCGRCSTPSTKLLPSQPRPWEAGTLQRLSSEAPIFSLQLGGCPPDTEAPRLWVGGVKGRCFPSRGRPWRKPGWPAGRGESLAAVAPSRGAHVTAVCFGRGSSRGQCKGVTPERTRAGVRGETRTVRWAAGGRAGVALAGPQRPGQSHPVSHPGCPDAALMHASARREGQPRPGSQEMRDRGGGAPPGEAGLEVVPSSSRGPQRMLEGDREGRSDTSSTWRTFPCAQLLQLTVLSSTCAGDVGAGRPGASPGWAPGWAHSCRRGKCISCSTPQTLKLFSLDCVLLRPGGGGNQG